MQEPAVGSMHLFLVAKSIKVIVYCKQSSMLPFMFYDLVQIGYAAMYVIVLYDLVQMCKTPICMSNGDPCIWGLNL